MNKKRVIIIVGILLLALVAVASYFIFRPKTYKPEKIDPMTLHKSFNRNLMCGLWQKETLYYRFNDDGTGCTWDEADDVTEAEAQKFSWKLDKDDLVMIFTMEISNAVIPKAYSISKLDRFNLEYHDDFKNYKLEKAD